ncbi:MAG: right-handed parallel beta-helix repeat-containing protein, partial [Clostridia bacterium]|nr:right-handed parallel beta-helix repeat-containing protein [Clostridia bacterium]
RQWEDITTAEITLPTSESLIEGSGTITYDKYEPIHNISFKDIDFAYTTVWNLFQQNGGLAIQQNATIYGPLSGGYQSAGNKILPAAVKLENVSYIDFEGCTFKKIGGMALAILGGIQHTDITGNEFYDISGNAMQIGMPKASQVIGEKNLPIHNEFFPLDKRYYKADIQITNNYMHDTAVEFVSAGAMAVTNLQYSNISHNEIFRTSYSGIHAAFGFSAKPSNLYVNTHIEHNYIHVTNRIKYHMEDGGGIYYMGTTHGDMRDAYTLNGRNRTSYNYMEDMGTSVNNIYLDEGTSWIEISHNVFDTKKPYWPYGQITTSNQGKYNIVTDNYLSTDSVSVQSKKQEPFTKWYEEYVANGSRMKDEDISRPDITTIGPHYILEGGMENWDKGALDIIANAGITAEYLDEFPEEFQDFKIAANSDGAYDAEPQRQSYDPAVYDVSTGEVFKIEFEATNRKKAKAEISPDRVFIDNHTPDVVEVLPDNSIKALKFGKAELTVQVLCGQNKDVVETYPVEVYVDDEVAPRSFSDAPTIWINGTPGLVKVRTGEANELEINYFETKLGRKLVPHELKLSTADENVGVIDEEGRFVGVSDGTTELILDMVWGANNKRGTFVREVKSLTNEMYEDFDESQIVDLGDDFFNLDNWTYIKEDATNIRENLEGGGIALASPQIMIYNKEKFNNKMLHFKMKLNHTGGWPSFAINSQDAVTHLQNEYILTFYQGSLEWQRYSGGQRYVLWGQMNMWDGVFPVYGGRPAAKIEYGKEYDVGIGAFDVPEGVRIVMYIDGIKAFDQIDYVTNKQYKIENQPVLSGGGYFGIHSTSGQFELYKADNAE